MKVNKAEAIDVLEQMATLLELRGDNVFKIRAFSNAARVLESAPQDLQELIETGELEKLKGIGKGISHVLRELAKTGKSTDFQELRKGFPDSLFDLFKIPGLGAKRIKVLYEELEVKSVGELNYACKENRLLDLDGFGVKSQEKILKGIEQLKKSQGHYLIDIAHEEAKLLVQHLKKQKGILEIQIAGSLRRSKEIVKDIDILVSAKKPAAIHKAFTSYAQVESVVAHGETKSSITLKTGINCDLRTVKADEFPYALLYFTGSKEHNVALRTEAKKKGIKINEYGLFKGKRKLVCKSEREIYEKLGHYYIPAEARENTGELELTAKKRFPNLVEQDDLRGIFHVHSTYSDGVAPLEKMIAAAQKMGYEYIGISDHSQSAKYAKGLEPERLRIQWKEMDALQKKFKIRIFKGIESDILGDGKLDYPDSVLSRFDFVIGSIHSRFTMPEKEMTERVRRAMDNKYLTFVGHPTGRLLLGRSGFAIDMTKIIDYAKKYNVIMEINANPHRLDLDWRLCQYAKKKKVLMSVNPDAHSLEGLEVMPYGIGIARKGWLEKKDIVNTLPVKEMEKLLKRRR